MKIHLCVHPKDAKEAEAWPFPVCHMAYRLGPGMELYRSGLGVNVRGGLLQLSDSGFNRSLTYSENLLREVLWECTNRAYSGIVCDFEGEPSPALREFVRDVDGALSKYKLKMYVPREYASSAPGARVFLSSGVTGGNCRERYVSDLRVFGPDRTALLIEPVAADILLPGEEGRGKALTPSELEALMRKEGGVPYLSRELCARYFTYRDEKNKSHFVLFDDSRSILKKLELAKETGFQEAFLLYPDAKEILEELKEL